MIYDVLHNLTCCCCCHAIMPVIFVLGPLQHLLSFIFSVIFMFSVLLYFVYKLLSFSIFVALTKITLYNFAPSSFEDVSRTTTSSKKKKKKWTQQHSRTSRVVIIYLPSCYRLPPVLLSPTWVIIAYLPSCYHFTSRFVIAYLPSCCHLPHELLFSA